jgi:histidyl-tRNA synthetase
MQPLPGFRDFLPKDCAVRNYIFERWREVARRYGFIEWDGPVLEPTQLYAKKSGPEIVGQLFNFIDKGEREVAMRPELTPTLARVVATHEREFKKPIKWFSIGQFFRYEKQQRGRLREHFQLNCDIVGEPNLGGDGELVALMIDVMREFAFTKEDFVVRLSSRDLWTENFLTQKFGHPSDAAQAETEFFQILDKIERRNPDETNQQLLKFGTSVQEVRDFIARTTDKLRNRQIDGVGEDIELGRLGTLLHDYLAPRGLLEFVQVDLTIVRGLAYYTGFVFEIFDRGKKLRSVAGGGRYDSLIGLLSDGAVSMPALGFAMGDVVLAELIAETPAARTKMDEAIAAQQHLDIYVVIAKEERRPDAFAEIQTLRDRGYRVDYPLTPAKVGKQFQTAEQLGARLALLFGDEWPEVKLKNLGTGEQLLVPNQTLDGRIEELLGKPAR